MGAISTTASGNWYAIVGSTAEATAELNRINAKPDRIRVSVHDTTDVQIYVGKP